MYNILYTPEAESNIESVFDYISDDNTFYAAKVITSIKNTIDILKIFPMSGKNIDSSNRFIVETKYKYKIIYSIKWNNIYILTIFKYQNYL